MNRGISRANYPISGTVLPTLGVRKLAFCVAWFLAFPAYAIDAPPPVCRVLKISEPEFVVVVNAIGMKRPARLNGKFGEVDEFHIHRQASSFVVLSADGQRQLAVWTDGPVPRCVQVVKQ